MDDSSQGCVKNMERKKPYFAMIFVQFVYAGMSISSKATITQGMNSYVFVTYRQAFATLALAPFALFIDRKNAPRLSLTLLCKIALVSSGITVSLNMLYFALNHVTATFGTALTNTSPAITFVLAVCFRMESLSIKQRHGVSKIIGSTIGLLGALVCTFARGPAMYSEAQNDVIHTDSSNDDWIKGSLIILAANTIWCLWLILQGPLIKQYPDKLRLMALQCLFSFGLSAIWAASNEGNVESWKIGWNVNLFSVLYCGGDCHCINILVTSLGSGKRGPVFTACFGPLALIITAIVSAFLFQETLHWGSVGGAMLLVIGLYGIIWGKNREGKAEKIDIEAKNEEEMEKSVKWI